MAAVAERRVVSQIAVSRFVAEAVGGTGVFVGVAVGGISIGVVSLLLLLAGVGSNSLMLMAVLAEMVVTPTVTGSSTVTAKVTVPVAALATLPMAIEQTEPALPLGAQIQPAVLAPALKAVLAGTFAVIWTLLAARLPLLV